MNEFLFTVENTDYRIWHNDQDELCICEYQDVSNQLQWLVVLESFDIPNLYDNDAVIFYDEFLSRVNIQLEEKHGGDGPTEPPIFENEIEHLKWIIANNTLFDGEMTLTQKKGIT